MQDKGGDDVAPLKTGSKTAYGGFAGKGWMGSFKDHIKKFIVVDFGDTPNDHDRLRDGCDR